MDENLTHIGIRAGWGADYPVSLSTTDLRQHLYVIGKTGSGKTTLLRNLIVQQIAPLVGAMISNSNNNNNGYGPGYYGPGPGYYGPGPGYYGPRYGGY